MHNRRTQYYLTAVLSLATLALYLPVLRNGFVNWDDNEYVYDNANIRTLSGEFFRWAFTSFHAGNWHPVTWVSHALDYALWGPDPAGHHLTSIVIHAVNTALVVILVSKLLLAWKERSLPAGGAIVLDDRGMLIVAGMTGLLFGIHPLHVESVAWIAERKDLLCGMFFLLSCIVYLWYVSVRESGKEGGCGPSVPSRPFPGGWNGTVFRMYALALAFFLLALLSKPMAVSLPVVLLLLDWYPLRRTGIGWSLKELIIEKLPFVGLSLVSAVLTLFAQSDALWTVAPPAPIRALVAARALTGYLQKMVLPLDLLPMYPYARDSSYYMSYSYALSVLLVVGVTAVSIKAIRKSPLWLATWGYYVVTLLPVIGIVQVGSQSMADRYTYLPSLAPFMLAGLGTAWVWERAISFGAGRGPFRLFLYSAAALLVVALATQTYHQEAIWKNSLALWNHVIAKEPDRVPGAYYNRGLAFKAAGRSDSALADFSRAIAIRPSYPDAFFNRGDLLQELGRFDQALEDFNAAITLRPTRISGYMHRGQLLVEIGWIDEALADYGTAIALDPYHAGAYVERGDILRRMGKGDLAAADFDAACGMGSSDGCAALQAGGPRGR